MKVVHRYVENEFGTRRVEESLIVDPSKPEDYPDWVAEALAVEEEEIEDPLKRRLDSFDPEAAAEKSEPAATIAWVAVKRAEAESAEPEDGESTDDEPEDDESTDDEPEDDESTDEVSAPPKGGAGSGVAEWARYAQSKNVPLKDGMTRDEIITACTAAGVPTE